MLAAAFVLWPCAARAQFGGDRVEGVIVSIRADILQVRPRFSTKLTRVVIDDKTGITSPQMIGTGKLQAGMRVLVMSDYDGKSAPKPRFIMTSEERAGFFAARLRGVQAMGYGDLAMFGGILKSVKPFVVTDDYGTDITAPLVGFIPVMQTQKRGREALLIGQAIQAAGEKTVDGLLHAKTVEIQQIPGETGTLFGEVVAVNGKTLEVRPRFADETVSMTLAENASLQRQVTIDPDTVKVGDTITAQGRRTSGSSGAPTAMTAFVLLRGRQTYPQATTGGFFAMMRGAGPSNQTATGQVASLSPFILTLADGGSVTVTIPGQTPVADLEPATLGDVKPGDKIMLVGSEGKEGGMVATMLVIGASPVVGFGG